MLRFFSHLLILLTLFFSFEGFFPSNDENFCGAMTDSARSTLSAAGEPSLDSTIVANADEVGNPAHACHLGHCAFQVSDIAPRLAESTAFALASIVIPQTYVGPSPQDHLRPPALV